MVLGSTLLYAVHTALTKRHMGEVDLLNFFFYRLLLTSAILALVVGARGELPSKWSGAADNSAGRHRRRRHQPLSLLLGAPTSRHEHSTRWLWRPARWRRSSGRSSFSTFPHRPAAARRRRNSGRCLPCRRRARLATSAAAAPALLLDAQKGSRVGVCNNLSAELGQGWQESHIFARKIERCLPGLPSVGNQTGAEIDAKVGRAAVTAVFHLSDIPELVNDRPHDQALTPQQLLLQNHESVLQWSCQPACSATGGAAAINLPILLIERLSLLVNCCWPASIPPA